jgi:hypothetical protein
MRLSTIMVIPREPPATEESGIHYLARSRERDDSILRRGHVNTIFLNTQQVWLITKS